MVKHVLNTPPIYWHQGMIDSGLLTSSSLNINVIDWLEKHSFPKWWSNGDLPWHKEKSPNKQTIKPKFTRIHSNRNGDPRETRM